jgi:hypothetical protein
MAITANDNIKALLKVYYKDGVENLMFRNSPVLKKLNKNRIEGKTYNFSAMYGRGGAVAGDFTKAKALAASVSKNVEFSVEPGQIFSVYTMNAKEVQASMTKRGAYMKVAGAKMFAASEGFRKTGGASLYARGFGELCFAPSSKAFTADTSTTITMPMDAIMKIDVGSQLVVKTSVTGGASSIKNTLDVTAIDGTTVTVTPTSTYTTEAGTDVICLAGSQNGSTPLLPVGLAGWLPTVASRSGSTWTNYIEDPFFGVDRSAAPDRLAGAFYKETSSTAKKYESVEALLMQVRRQGSQADMIIVNDSDWRDIANEIATTNTYFTQTSTKSKREANIGFNAFSASFSTNYIENVIDDPYCPKGTFYILDSGAVEFDTYTNTDKVDDGVAGNEPGKPDPMTDDNNGHEDANYKLLIDDFINVQSGTGSVDGPAADVTLMLFGSFVVTNPSVCGVGLFYGANPVSTSL